MCVCERECECECVGMCVCASLRIELSNKPCRKMNVNSFWSEKSWVGLGEIKFSGEGEYEHKHVWNIASPNL